MVQVRISVPDRSCGPPVNPERARPAGRSMNSWSIAEIGLVVGYLGTLGLLCVYGLHRLELVWRLRRPARRTIFPG